MVKVVVVYIVWQIANKGARRCGAITVLQPLHGCKLVIPTYAATMMLTVAVNVAQGVSCVTQAAYAGRGLRVLAAARVHWRH